MLSPEPRIVPEADTPCSVVSASGEDERETVAPAYFGDLNLDQVAVAFSEGMPAKDLDPLFMTALQSVDAVDYRHEVVRDLYSDEVMEPIRRFVDEMHRMREHLGHVDQSRHRLQRQALFLEAVEGYCDAVASLDHGLHGLTLDSRGLRRFRTALRAYVSSVGFIDLCSGVARLKAFLSEVRYAIRVTHGHVTVSRYADEPDYSEEVRSVFARFQQHEVPVHGGEPHSSAQLDHVEGRILDGLEELYPDLFAERAAFYARRDDFLDATVDRFDREVQFYLAWFDLIGPLRAAGLPFCLPEVSRESTSTLVEETFDIALALQLVSEGHSMVCNDVRLNGDERLLVVTGPNSGGKTTFARAFGQLHHLAALGLPIPGRRATLLLPDQIFTHFQREEELASLTSKFEDELVRARTILQNATGRSVVVLNESFGSTSLSDAIHVGGRIVTSLLDRGCIGVYVTFIDEIASLDNRTVSMVSQVASGDPAERTFVVHRAPADGRAHAWAIAKKYELGEERLMQRLAT